MLPARSVILTVNDPPAATAAWSWVTEVFPSANDTEVSAAKIVVSVARATPSKYRVAEPSVASPAMIVAVALKSVFVAVSLLRVVTPPIPIAESSVGAVGAIVSMTIAAFAPNDPDEPGAINAVLLALPERSLIVPPFNTRAAPDCTSRSGVRSPA